MRAAFVGILGVAVTSGLVACDADGGGGGAGGSLLAQPRAGVATGPATTGSDPGGSPRLSAVEVVADPQAGWVWVDRDGSRVATALVLDGRPDDFAGGFARIVGSSPAGEVGLVGFLAADGRVAIPPRFGFARPFVEERAAFCAGCRQLLDPSGRQRGIEGGLWGFVDPTGREVVPALYTRAEDYADGVAMVCTADGGCLRFDREGLPVPLTQPSG